MIRRNTMLILMVAAIAAMTLTGCGGGGDGTGAVNVTDILGTWQVFAALADGQVRAPANVMGWDQGVVRMEALFAEGGALTVRYYDAEGNDVLTETGTWAAADGNLTITSATDGDTQHLTYQIQGNLMETTETQDGEQVQLRWAKVTEVSEHEQHMAGMWAVEATTVNGQSVSPIVYFGADEAADGIFAELRADGTLIFRESLEGQFGSPEQGTWATGGGEIVFSIDGDMLRGAYAANDTSVTLLDPDGNTVTIEFRALTVPGQVDPALVGTWQPYAATANGDGCAIAEALNFDGHVARTELTFNNDGTFDLTEYQTDGSSSTSQSLWGAENGQVHLLVGATLETLAYTISGNLIDTTFTKGGIDYAVSWVKVVDLTGHDAQMVATWTVASATANGGDAPFAEPGTDGVSIQMLADGTLSFYQLLGDEIVASETGTWVTGGGAITLTLGDQTMRGAYTTGSPSITFTNEIGSWIHLNLSALAPAGERDESVVGVWSMASATVDGTSVNLADFFEWDARTTSMTVAFFADGAVISREYDRFDVVTYADLGTWNTDGGTLTLNIDETIVMDSWSVSGDTATMSLTQEGSAVVLTLQRAG